MCLEDAGNQPLLEPAPGETPMWAYARLSALFPVSSDTEEIYSRLVQLGYTGLTWARLDDQEWERAWLDDFEAMQFGHRLWVCPGDLPHPEDALVVELDPGLAFGTGSHPTTALCLEWLDAEIQPGDSLIDYGCGSGILSVAAARLGADHVVAVDIDPQALIATRDNATRNNVSGKIEASMPGDLELQPADVLIANILAQPLIDLAARFAQLVRPGGRIVLSGILDDQAEGVARVYREWFDLDELIYRTGWARITGIRNSVHSVSAV